MIKIIETKPDTSVVKRVVCNNCGVKLEYTPNDTKLGTKNHDYLGDYDRCRYITCLNCKNKIEV